MSASHWLTLELWLAKDNRFLNPKSSYGRIQTAPPCRLIIFPLIADYKLKEKKLKSIESRQDNEKVIRNPSVSWVFFPNKQGILELLLCRGFFSFISTVSVHQRSYYYRLEENPLKWLCEIALETIFIRENKK